MNTKNINNKERVNSVGSNLKDLNNLNITRTFNNLQHNKSNSLSFNLNQLNNLQNLEYLNKHENSNNLSGINSNFRKEDNKYSNGYYCNNNFNNMSYLYKKVQPKIIKNITSKVNSIQCNFF